VLLIIFMVIIPNMQGGKTIEMIKVEAADKPDDGIEPLAVTIDRNEVYTLDDSDLPRQQVLDSLSGSFAQNPERRVLLRADATLPYKTVRDFFADVQQIGFVNISLAVGVAREWSEAEGG
jgi:biopolymer transport protein ExbD